MHCPECGNELEQDDVNDSSFIESDSCQHNFKCTNEEGCGKSFVIEYHACEITES